VKILVFDNYDSFTYNLVHLVEKITHEKVDVRFNDAIHLDEIAAYDRVILSPGPGIPSEAGLLLPLIKRYAVSKPILGVCLGHQAIAEAFGAGLINMDEVFHGIAMPLHNIDPASSLLKGVPPGALVARYHSWMVDKANFPRNLKITATDANGDIMALEHIEFDVQGVQFHPESIMTDCGERILRNWLVK
jgi:anthranilate synthase component 2